MTWKFASPAAAWLAVALMPALAFGAEGARDERIPLRLSDSTTVTATLRLPKDAGVERRLPAVLVFGGFESAARVLDLVPPDAPVALASFDYPYSGPRDFGLAGTLRALPEARKLFPRTVEGIVALARALRSRPEIDPSRIVVIGASFGSPFALSAAAAEPTIRGIAIVHGFGNGPEAARHALLRNWLPRHGWIARPAAWLLSRLAWTYLSPEAPEAAASRLRNTQNALLITAANDSFIPRECSDSLWDALRSSRAATTRLLMPTDHLMPGSEAIIAEIFRKIELWMGQTGSLPGDSLPAK